MKKQLVKITSLSLLASSLVYGGGYKIPETSTNAVALGAANVAHSLGAEAAYSNPANMSFMDDKNAFELDLMYIGLDPANFKGSGSMAGVDIDAESEHFFIPSFNYVSPKLGDFRVGLSVAVPGGLTKRWSDGPAVYSAKEFSLQVVEVNPTVSYQINDTLSVALGLRIVESEGVVKSVYTASRDLIGESFDYGYNIALAYKPTKNMEFGITYRSNVDLTEEGNAELTIGNAVVYDGGASVMIPLPALLNVAAAYTFETKTTVEFVYERNFWSSYEELDFDYSSNIPLILQSSFDAPITKDWEDVNVFRLGVTQELNEYTLMAGLVIDNTPVPDEKVSFELPDSDSVAISFGGRYQYNQDFNFGLGILYSIRDSRDVKNDTMEGEFSNSNVLIASVGVEYKF
jgi:long-chain fatty acid transport protein